MGDVRCGRIVHYRSTEPNKKHPTLPGFVNINVTSGGPWKALSPMKIGPFSLVEPRVPMPAFPDGVHPGFVAISETEQQAVCQVFENYWQYSKVFDIDIAPDGTIGPSFFRRRAQGFADPSGHRRAIPKKQGRPVAAYFNGEVLSYVPSRRYYCNHFEALVQLRPEYQRLVQMRDQGTNLFILGYDGRDIPLTVDSVAAAYEDPTVPFGHELVIACMLKGLHPWR